MARLAGVSTAVVSYVINDGPRPVSAAARSRVLAAVEHTGYRVNDVARALAGGRTRTFGFVAPNLANPFISEIGRRLALAAEARGALLFVGDTTDDTDREDRLIRSFVQRQVDGIVYMSVGERLSPVLADGCDIRTVVLQHADQHPLLASVRIDEPAGAKDATEHLVEHGYRRFGAVFGRAELLNSRMRHEGWAAALDDASVPDRDRHVRYTVPTRQGGFEAGRALLEEAPEIEAVFTGNEDQAVGVISAAAEAGRRVPHDLAVVAFNGSAESRFHVPPLTVMRQPISAMVQRVTDLLDAASYLPDDHVFASELVLRRSCGCRYSVGNSADNSLEASPEGSS